MTWIPNVFLLSMCPTFVQKGLYLIDSVNYICVEMNGKEKWPKSDIFLLTQIWFHLLFWSQLDQIRPEPLSFVALRSQIRFISDVYNASSVWTAMLFFFRLSRQWNATGLKILQRSRSYQTIPHGAMKETIDCTQAWMELALCPLTSGGRQKW